MAAINAVSEMENHYLIPENTNIDIEKRAGDNNHLQNTTVHEFVWQDITVTVKDHKTKQSRTLLEGVNGIVKAGIKYRSDSKKVTNLSQARYVLSWGLLAAVKLLC